MTSYTTDRAIASGDFNGDGYADVASIWDDGLWYQDGATLGWTKIFGTAPDSLTAGDVTGDGRSEIIGTWSSGLLYWNGASSTQFCNSSSVADPRSFRASIGQINSLPASSLIVT